jgi:hypothetical protein
MPRDRAGIDPSIVTDYDVSETLLRLALPQGALSGSRVGRLGSIQGGPASPLGTPNQPLRSLVGCARIVGDSDGISAGALPFSSVLVARHTDGASDSRF